MTDVRNLLDLDADPERLAAVTAAVAAAARPLADSSPQQRSALLEAAADVLDAHRDELVALADEETFLGDTRLAGEVARTTGQLRLFADVVREASYLEATIDHADPDATPPHPDVRRVLQPMGPVAVFSASNFPFAFSVAGGDTASALAAGCPVVVKAHSGHPRLSARVADLVDAALREAGSPEGTFACVAGRETGRRLVQDPHIRAVGFTGSLEGGRALFDLAVGRSDPIPFYGELSSINPVLVTAEAVRRRGQAIARGLVDSFTLGVGQFCTKPGVILVPRASGFEAQVAAALGARGEARMLTSRMADGFRARLTELDDSGLVEVVAGAAAQPESGGVATPVLLATDAAHVTTAAEVLLAECFGPACLLVRYGDEDELRAAVDALPGSLTASVHAEEDELGQIDGPVRRLQELAGRVIWNGWPTGVAVNWAMHHGGPWPSTTNPLHTSVGATAIRRFLRPVAYQNAPAGLLPPALRDDNPLGLPRRVDGTLTLSA